VKRRSQRVEDNAFHLPLDLHIAFCETAKALSMCRLVGTGFCGPQWSGRT
jgi:hypothetical protein